MARLQQAQEQQERQQQLEHQRYIAFLRQQREQSDVQSFIPTQHSGQAVGSTSTTTGTSSYAHVPVHVPRPSPGDPHHGGWSGMYTRCPEPPQPPNTHTNTMDGRIAQDQVPPQMWPREGALYPPPLPELIPPGIGTHLPGHPRIGCLPPSYAAEDHECAPGGQPQ